MKKLLYIIISIIIFGTIAYAQRVSTQDTLVTWSKSGVRYLHFKDTVTVWGDIYPSANHGWDVGLSGLHFRKAFFDSVTSGKWRGDAIEDAYISSATTWTAARESTLAHTTDIGEIWTALNNKSDSSTTNEHIRNVSNPHTVTKTQVGLGNADNTSDANKPVSSATQSALDLKLDATRRSTFSKSGEVTFNDSLRIIQGANMTITQSGNTWTFASEAGGGGTWGSITGTLSDQTDLDSALSTKEPTVTKGNLTEATSSVLTITGGTGAVIGAGLSIQVKIASGTQGGYLSSGDWTTFNTAYQDRLKWDGGATGLDAATGRTSLGLVIGTNVQAYNANLTTYAGITPLANTQSFLAATDYAAMRTLLGLVIGTNVQAYDADLTTYAGITPSANVQTLLGAADYDAFKTSLGKVPTATLADNATDAYDVADSVKTPVRPTVGDIVKFDTDSGLVSAGVSGALLDTNNILITKSNLAANIPATGVEASSYTDANITIGADGRITAASSGTGGGTSDLTGTAAFTGVDQIDTVYNANISEGDIFTINAKFDTPTPPTANDNIGYCVKEDTLFPMRPASGTTNMGYSWARTGTGFGFNPLNLSSISVKLWAEAWKEVGKVDDEVLTSLADNSSYANHLYSYHVKYKTGGQNGRPYYFFNGLTDSAYASSGSTSLNLMNGLDGKYIIFALLDADSMYQSASRNYHVAGWFDSGNGSYYQSNHWRYVSGANDTSHLAMQAAGRDTFPSSYINPETRQYVMSPTDSTNLTTNANIVVWSKSLDSAKIYFNNLTAVMPATEVDIDSMRTNKFIIGCYQGSSTRASFMAGKLYGIIVAQPLNADGWISDSDLSYILTKWDTYYATPYTP